ncbi:hypothetical protein BDQ17DRAFT_1335787 [Cyathus striatus]|nr:hypothetical protein BDQ17DRAFT_1335787 [Cyathus striatus]
MDSPQWRDLDLEDGLAQVDSRGGKEKKKQGRNTNAKGKAGSKKCAVGQPAGVRGFSATEITKLLRLIKAVKPIGQDGWDAVVKSYEKWAKEKGTVFGLALECSNLIEGKSGSAVFMDSDDEDGANEDIVIESDEDGVVGAEDSDSHVVDLTVDIDDETEITPESPPSKKNKKAVVKTEENSGGIVRVKKGYRSENVDTPEVSTRGCRGGAQATDTLAAISAYFNPMAAQQCDDVRSTQALYILQLQSLQNENGELRKRIETLTDRLQEETACAIRAEAKLEVLQIQLPQHGSPLTIDFHNFNPTSSPLSRDLKH